MKSPRSANTSAQQPTLEPTNQDVQSLLRATLDSSSKFIQVFQALRDHTRNIIDFTWILTNRRSQEVYGDVIGKRLLNQNPTVIEMGIFERMVEVVQTGVSQTQEHYNPIEPLNGWFYLTFTKLNDGVVLTTEDITPRKLVEQELLRLKEQLAQQATQKYLELFQSIDQGFCTITVRYDEADRPIDYQFNEVSPSFEYQTGIKEGAGKWMKDIAADQDQFWFDVYGRVAKDRQSERFEYFSTPLARWWSVYAFPIDSPERRRIGVLFNDITDRKKAETQQAYLLTLSDGLRGLADAGQIQREALRILGEHLQVDRVLYAEVEPDDTHFVIDANYAQNSTFPMIGRFPLSDFGQIPIWQRLGQTTVIPNVNQAGELAEHLGVYRTDGIGSLIAIPLLKGGRWVASLAVHHGRPRQWMDLEVTLVEQTAERTWAALERARVEKALSEANRRKDEFLALLAHELRNPMATLNNVLLILQLTGGKDPGMPLDSALELMSREMGQLMRLVDDLLDASRISRGITELRSQRLDLTELVQTTAEAARPLVETDGRRLNVKLPPEPLYLNGDAARLTQVIRNLLGNAAKFTRSGGHLRLSLEQRNHEALLRMADDGIGIAADQLQRIFEMFAQVDASGTRSQQGLGLGLTLV